MGYTTNFTGEFHVEPPLSPVETAFLQAYAATRHCTHQPSPYAADAGYGCPRTFGNCVSKGEKVPSLWCQWIPSEDGTMIQWDGMEKFYAYTEWLKFLIQHFLMPGAHALREPAALLAAEVGGPGSVELTARVMSAGGHVLDGVIEWQGEEPGDAGRIIVKDNAVMTQVTQRSYGGIEEV